MGGEQAGGTPPPSTESTGRRLSAWHVVVVMGLVGGLVGGTFAALEIVVPIWVSVVGAIGLAAIVAYSAGKRSGHEAGTAQGRVAGQAEGRRAALSARREATQKILGFINTGASGLGAFHDQVQTVAFNPPDENRLVLGAIDAEGLYVQSVDIPNNQVIAAREALGAARGACELLLSEGE